MAIDNMNSFNRFDRKLYHEVEQEKFWDSLKLNTFVGSVLYANGYEYYNQHQANQDFRSLMGLDKEKDIKSDYQVIQNGEILNKSETITKSNFWNAFYEPIWNSLEDDDKIRALEWLFDFLKNKNNLDARLTYIPSNEKNMADTYHGSCSVENSKNNPSSRTSKNPKKDSYIVYVNLNLLKRRLTPYELIDTIVHELEHVKQMTYISGYNGSDKKDYYTISQQSKLSYNNFNYKGMYVPSDVETALYRLSENEKGAVLQALKFLKKIQKLNQEKYGSNYEIDNNIEKFIRKNLIGKIPQNFEETNGLFTNDMIVLKGQGQNLLKIMMAKTYYEKQKYQLSNKMIAIEQEKVKCLYAMRDEKQRIAMVNRQYEIDEMENELKIETAQVAKKISLLIETFNQTLKDGKLPDDFDAKKEFEVLNIIDEEAPKSFISKKFAKEEYEALEELTPIRDNLKKKEEEKIKNRENIVL